MKLILKSMQPERLMGLKLKYSRTHLQVHVSTIIHSEPGDLATPPPHPYGQFSKWISYVPKTHITKMLSIALLGDWARPPHWWRAFWWKVQGGVLIRIKVGNTLQQCQVVLLTWQWDPHLCA